MAHIAWSIFLSFLHLGFPFAFWMLLHYVTVQASDEDARICAAIIANYFLTFYHNDRSISDFAVQLKEHSLNKVTNNQTLVLWLWQIHVGMVQNGKHKKSRYFIIFSIE